MGAGRTTAFCPVAVHAEHLEARREAMATQPPVDRRAAKDPPVSRTVAVDMVNGQELWCSLVATGTCVSVVVEHLLLELCPAGHLTRAFARLAVAAGSVKAGSCFGAQREVLGRERALASGTPVVSTRKRLATGSQPHTESPAVTRTALSHARLASNHNAVLPGSAHAERGYGQRFFAVPAHPVIHWTGV